MKLNIKNFAKINDADIIIDGITVIAGENNTGKSTVGKILFALFNALSDIDNKIFEERVKTIEGTNRRIVQNYISNSDISRSMVARTAFNITGQIDRRLRERIDNNWTVTIDDVSCFVTDAIKAWQKAVPDFSIENCSELVNEIYNNVSEILSLAEKTIVLEIVSRYFNEVFHSQIQSLSERENSEAVLALEIKGKQEKLVFENNDCKDYMDEISITHKAIYIDNPFIVDQLSTFTDLNPMNDLLKDLLNSKPQDSVLDGVIETVRAKEKLSDIYSTLQSVVDGEIVSGSNNDEFYLKSTNCKEPILFQNLSTGMKSFVILKMLLEKGCMMEKDVVILDEPEIHLHPQWQIAYAELIVLLQKHFDLSVVVTTHSPYFVDAINLFSCKYGSDDRVNYYLSSNDDNVVKMECVTKDIDLIYKKMASPIQMLETLRYELNNSERVIRNDRRGNERTS